VGHFAQKFSHIVINLLQPLNSTKYATPQLTDTDVCQINWQYFGLGQLNIPLQPEWQSCISQQNHVYI